ncbi:protein PXR1-like [Ischnura elegans]|uniref:protein PXR1-like n=1 Tax=Ischnura elegans TaxID=197161 RepID=UPI001ED89142|nr:protein PXR1-like [Ischnura elegans]
MESKENEQPFRKSEKTPRTPKRSQETPMMKVRREKEEYKKRKEREEEIEEVTLSHQQEKKSKENTPSPSNAGNEKEELEENKIKNILKELERNITSLWKSNKMSKECLDDHVRKYKELEHLTRQMTIKIAKLEGRIEERQDILKDISKIQPLETVTTKPTLIEIVKRP